MPKICPLFSTIFPLLVIFYCDRGFNEKTCILSSSVWNTFTACILKKGKFSTLQRMNNYSMIERKDTLRTFSNWCYFLVKLRQCWCKQFFRSLHEKWSFPLSISPVNVIKSARNCGFGHIYWRNPGCQWTLHLKTARFPRMSFNF